MNKENKKIEVNTESNAFSIGSGISANFLSCTKHFFHFQEIVVNNVSPLLHTVPFFSNASREFIADIVSKLRFEVYLTGEYICKTGRKGDKMYFIQRGIVDVLTRDGVLATSLGDGSHFGGKAGFGLRSKCIFSFITLDDCHTLSFHVNYEN